MDKDDIVTAGDVPPEFSGEKTAKMGKTVGTGLDNLIGAKRLWGR